MWLPLKYVPDPDDDDDGAFNYIVRLYGEKVAFIYSSRTGSRVKLLDVRVEEAPTGCGPWHCRMLRQIGLWPPKLRNRGIGTKLLRLFLQWADAEGIEELWGEVTHAALRENRDLLGWYRKHGFTIYEPDAECKLSGVAKKVVRFPPSG